MTSKNGFVRQCRFNRTFLEILDAFHNFGPLTAIDPEFKLRLYETFLKNTPRQQKLGPSPQREIRLVLWPLPA
jgi:hypothetical protein